MTIDPSRPPAECGVLTLGLIGVAAAALVPYCSSGLAPFDERNLR
jgi:hypothetical protein